ncbi:MAG: ribulose-bisphosphate carboxylase large subunit family protein [Pikeienuella sp.]|uniref:ribulose-bisphosphate carboxylase large subunit family protein n=1 Tax=Pikeienuella sp. TaxID=2831957 RepID=UPI00391DBA37
MSRVTATYEIESPVGVARAAEVLAGEQSTGTFVRLAAETDALRERSAARIEAMEITGVSDRPALPCRLEGERFERGTVTISWPVGTFGTSLQTLMATVAGNLFELAELSACRLTGLTLPEDFARAHPGPQFGAAGTRAKMGGHEGPLIGTIVKPSVGLSPEETGALAASLAEAGIDFIKDDELQSDGPDCPLAERVAAVMAVLNRHADRTGKRIVYAFNISGEVDEMRRRLDLLSAHGATCAMVCLNAVGLSGLRDLRNHSPHLIHGHRAGWGLFSRSPHIGVGFPVMQKFWRLAGADHLHVNGLASKFTEPDASVAASARAVQAPVAEGGPAHPAMPVFSSGQTIRQVGPTRALLGNDDLIFCAGGGILSHPGGAGAGVRALRQAAEAARDGVALEDAAARHPELAAAMKAFPPVAFG